MIIFATIITSQFHLPEPKFHASPASHHPFLFGTCLTKIFVRAVVCHASKNTFKNLRIDCNNVPQLFLCGDGIDQFCRQESKTIVTL